MNVCQRRAGFARLVVSESFVRIVIPVERWRGVATERGALKLRAIFQAETQRIIRIDAITGRALFHL
jgi:hypothetical protein